MTVVTTTIICGGPVDGAGVVVVTTADTADPADEVPSEAGVDGPVPPLGGPVSPTSTAAVLVAASLLIAASLVAAVSGAASPVDIADVVPVASMVTVLDAPDVVDELVVEVLAAPGETT